MCEQSKQYKRDGYIVISFSPETDAAISYADNLFKLPDVKGRYMKYYENTYKGRILDALRSFSVKNSNYEHT